jgi:hypothetical protein
MDPNKIIYENLKTTDEKRIYALKHITDEKFIKLLEWDKISLSTINIAFYSFLGEEIELRGNSSKLMQKEQRKF